MIAKVSVIIPAKNEENNIEHCLQSINSQSLKPFDCIVVDNGSEDKTVQKAIKHGAKIIIRPEISVGELRNIGASYARGDILSFIDAVLHS